MRLKLDSKEIFERNGKTRREPEGSRRGKGWGFYGIHCSCAGMGEGKGERKEGGRRRLEEYEWCGAARNPR